MQTYIGHIKTPQDALIVLEACRQGVLQRVQHRLMAKERSGIRSGQVFAWDERETGMRRWTDGRTWSPSRVSGSFLTYRELSSKRRPRRHGSKAAAPMYAYKPGGLVKQSFSICTAANQKLHLISYFTKDDVHAGRLLQPSADPALRHMAIPAGLYPEPDPLLLRHPPPPPPPLLPSSSSSSSSDDDDPLASPVILADRHRAAAAPPPPAPLAGSLLCSTVSSEDRRQLHALHRQLRL